MGATTVPVARSAYFQPGVLARLESDEDQLSYATVIEDLDDASLLVAAPLQAGGVVAFPRDLKLTLVVERRNNPYFFEIRVLGPEEHEGKPYLRISRPADTSARQLREMVRIPVLLEAQAVFLDRAGKGQGLAQNATILDLSAGGAQIVLRQRAPTGSDVLLTFALGSAGPRVSVQGSIRTVAEGFNRGVEVFRCGVQFASLDRRLQEQIVKYVLARERELLRQGGR